MAGNKNAEIARQIPLAVGLLAARFHEFWSDREPFEPLDETVFQFIEPAAYLLTKRFPLLADIDGPYFDGVFKIGVLESQCASQDELKQAIASVAARA